MEEEEEEEDDDDWNDMDDGATATSKYTFSIDFSKSKIWFLVTTCEKKYIVYRGQRDVILVFWRTKIKFIILFIYFF